MEQQQTVYGVWVWGAGLGGGGVVARQVELRPKGWAIVETQDGVRHRVKAHNFLATPKARRWYGGTASEAERWEQEQTVRA